MDLKARIAEYRDYLRADLTGGSGVAVSDRRLAAAALVACLALAVLHTWPLATAPGRAVAQRQRRHDAQRVDRGVGRPPGAARSAAPVRRQHLLSRAALAGVLRAHGRAGRHGRARSSGSAHLPSSPTTCSSCSGSRSSAWAMWMVVRRWTGSAAAGVVAGIAARLQRAHADAAPSSAGVARGVPAPRAARVRPGVGRAGACATRVLLGVAVALQSLTLELPHGLRRSRWSWPQSAARAA